MYILDTNVVSELRKESTGRADRNVVAWAAGVPALSLFLSSITIHEIEVGILRVERCDPPQGTVLRKWLEGYVLTAFNDRILPIDTTVARRSAALHVPDPRSAHDAFIAATALVHGMTVVTRNVADFEPTKVRIVNPWADSSDSGEQPDPQRQNGRGNHL